MFTQHHEQGIIIFISNMFFFTCGVALTGYSVVTYNGSPIENMEMVVSSAAMHKLIATDKELPIQFCGERENGTRNVAVSLLLAAKDTNEQIFCHKLNSLPSELHMYTSILNNCYNCTHSFMSEHVGTYIGRWEWSSL